MQVSGLLQGRLISLYVNLDTVMLGFLASVRDVTREMKKRGKSVLVLDKRSHIGGNCFTEDVEGIAVHKYGAHIFHTSDREVWDYVNELVEFNRYTNSPLARFGEELYNLPFNMNTFHQLWGVKTPGEARARIEESVRRSRARPLPTWRNRQSPWWGRTSTAS